MGIQVPQDGDVVAATNIVSGFGESPFWDTPGGAVVWVDIESQEVRRLEPESGRYQHWPMGQYIGAAVPRAGGGMVVALGAGFGRLNPADGSVTVFAPIDVGTARVQLNDCQCDSAGRLWGGTQGDASHAACLYRLDPDHSLKVMLSGVTVSNGIGWSADERHMYYVDSHEGRVDQFDYDLSSGEIANRRPLVVVPREDGVPDGLCVDAQGMIWVALFGGAAIHRYTPAGDLDRKLAVPAPHVTSCTFGGDDQSTLYITTARTPLTLAQLNSSPLAGCLLAHRANVRGQRPRAYSG